jgi:hypothetical protein
MNVPVVPDSTLSTGLSLPDFIIAGAPRSGTGWLCSLLARHPQIGLAQPIAPEPKFFLVDDLYEQGLAYYSKRWFADIDRAVKGEKSTNYLENAQCATRIAESLPKVKLIFLFRNPVDRAFSNYRWSRKNGHETEAFNVVLALDGKRETDPRLRYARPFDYLSRGRYAELLRPFLDAFARDRILFLAFDDVLARPETVAATVHGFLGVERRPADALCLPPVNQADSGEMDAKSRAFLVDYYAQPNQDLANLTGFDISRWRD